MDEEEELKRISDRVTCLENKVEGLIKQLASDNIGDCSPLEYVELLNQIDEVLDEIDDELNNLEVLDFLLLGPGYKGNIER